MTLSVCVSVHARLPAGRRTQCARCACAPPPFFSQSTTVQRDTSTRADPPSTTSRQTSPTQTSRCSFRARDLSFHTTRPGRARRHTRPFPSLRTRRSASMGGGPACRSVSRIPGTSACSIPAAAPCVNNLLHDREERVDAERVVDHHARDAHHRRAAVVALDLREGGEEEREKRDTGESQHMEVKGGATPRRRRDARGRSGIGNPHRRGEQRLSRHMCSAEGGARTLSLKVLVSGSS